MKKHTLFIVCILCFCLGVPGATLADNENIDDYLDGFEDDGLTYTETKTSGEPSRIRLSGYAKLSTVGNYAHTWPETGEIDYRDLYRLRTELDAKLDLALVRDWKMRVGGRFWHDCAYDINGREDYTEEVLAQMENESELWEAYVEGSLFSGLDLKLGRQIIVWGTSDNIRVVDVINPLDNRETGMVDIEGLRLPVAMVRADYTVGKWTLTGLAIPEIRQDKMPPLGGEFYPADEPDIENSAFMEQLDPKAKLRQMSDTMAAMGMVSELPQTPEALNDPACDSFENMEYGAAITGRLSGWDISLYYADIYKNMPYYDVEQPYRLTRPPIILPPAGPGLPPTILAGPVIAGPVIKKRYVRVHMYGASTGIVMGNWLLKAEAAYFTGLRFSNMPDEDRESIDALLGLEYSGFTDTTISFDAAHRHQFDHEDALKDFPDYVRENQREFALRVQRDFANDTFHLVFLGTMLDDGDDGWFVRCESSYDWTDNLTTTLGVVGYGAADDGAYAYIKNNDCVFLDIKYSF